MAQSCELSAFEIACTPARSSAKLLSETRTRDTEPDLIMRTHASSPPASHTPWNPRQARVSGAGSSLPAMGRDPHWKALYQAGTGAALFQGDPVTLRTVT